MLVGVNIRTSYVSAGILSFLERLKFGFNGAWLFSGIVLIVVRSSVRRFMFGHIRSDRFVFVMSNRIVI